jgi:hypothetical protein
VELDNYDMGRDGLSFVSGTLVSDETDDRKLSAFRDRLTNTQGSTLDIGDHEVAQ